MNEAKPLASDDLVVISSNSDSEGDKIQESSVSTFD